jgi:hypothetical protein
MLKAIFEDFRAGSARERLAILADVMSVVGISVAAVLSPLLGGISLKRFWAYIAAGAIALSLLAALSVFVAVCLGLSHHVRKQYAQPRGMAVCLSVAVWLFFAVILLLAVWIGVYYIPGFFVIAQ